MKGLFKLSLVLLSICVLMIGYVYATSTNPTGPQTITRVADEKFNASSWPAIQINAEAGNVTELTISSLTQTQTWQGYYGNITGTIVLDDVQNWTMYSWATAEPQGEIYASNGSSVTWSKIRCVNYTNNGTAGYNENITILEIWLGLVPNDYDGVDETFNDTGKLQGGTDHSSFYVGPYLITSGTCPATDTYEVDSSTGDNFQEVLLTDNTSIIFTTIIENNLANNLTDIPGFDNRTWDFQMLVGDDGHNGNTAATSYYFFVELE